MYMIEQSKYKETNLKTTTMNKVLCHTCGSHYVPSSIEIEVGIDHICERCYYDMENEPYTNDTNY